MRPGGCGCGFLIVVIIIILVIVLIISIGSLGGGGYTGGSDGFGGGDITKSTIVREALPVGSVSETD
jgi:ABC-type cobalt transport system substrate-binding protein